MASGAFLDLAAAIVDQARAPNAAVVINDRADIARLSGAQGVHVGQDDLRPLDVRAVAGDAVAIGASTHTLAQIDAALGEPVDYIAIGPVFGTTTKSTGYGAVGLGVVRAAADRARSARTPLVAIGGITLETAPAVIEAGAASVAMIGDLLAAGDPERRVREYLRALGETPL